MPGPIAAGYPGNTKQVAGSVDGKTTNVMVISFTDRIVVTISQSGRLAQWVRMHGSVAGALCSDLIRLDLSTSRLCQPKPGRQFSSFGQRR